MSFQFSKNKGMKEGAYENAMDEIMTIFAFTI